MCMYIKNALKHCKQSFSENYAHDISVYIPRAIIYIAIFCINFTACLSIKSSKIWNIFFSLKSPRVYECIIYKYFELIWNINFDHQRAKTLYFASNCFNVLLNVFNVLWFCFLFGKWLITIMYLFIFDAILT